MSLQEKLILKSAAQKHPPKHGQYWFICFNNELRRTGSTKKATALANQAENDMKNGVNSFIGFNSDKIKYPTGARFNNRKLKNKKGKI